MIEKEMPLTKSGLPQSLFRITVLGIQTTVVNWNIIFWGEVRGSW